MKTDKNMFSTDFFYSIIIVLLGAIGYFVKRILDKTDNAEGRADTIQGRIEKIGSDVSEMTPKVKVLWERAFASAASPLTLNEFGAKILHESGIKELVDAFKTGVNVDAVLFVGGLYFRDLALPKYNFHLSDIDEKQA